MPSLRNVNNCGVPVLLAFSTGPGMLNIQLRFQTASEAT